MLEQEAHGCAKKSENCNSVEPAGRMKALQGAFLLAAVDVTCRLTWRLEVNKHLFTWKCKTALLENSLNSVLLKNLEAEERAASLPGATPQVASLGK